MRDVNPRARAREKFELSLDGRQVASVVAGALVVLGVVFVLGLNVGRQLAVRQLEASRPGDLAALDRAPAPPPRAEPLTFHDRLTKDVPSPPPPVPVAVPVAATPPPAPAPATPPPAPAPAPAAAAPARPADPRDAALAEAPPAAARPWTIQLAASESRAEAERLAARFTSLNPRVEEADVPGKGRFFRVRVGRFETREAAQRYLRDAERETGAKGIVAPTR